MVHAFIKNKIQASTDYDNLDVDDFREAFAEYMSVAHTYPYSLAPTRAPMPHRTLEWALQVPLASRQRKQRVFVITRAAAAGVCVRPIVPVRELFECEFKCVNINNVSVWLLQGDTF